MRIKRSALNIVRTNKARCALAMFALTIIAGIVSCQSQDVVKPIKQIRETDSPNPYIGCYQLQVVPDSNSPDNFWQLPKRIRLEPILREADDGAWPQEAGYLASLDEPNSLDKEDFRCGTWLVKFPSKEIAVGTIVLFWSSGFSARTFEFSLAGGEWTGKGEYTMDHPPMEDSPFPKCTAKLIRLECHKKP